MQKIVAAECGPDADRQRRIASEAAMIAQADASVAAGRLVDGAQVDAWIDSIGTEHELHPDTGRNDTAGDVRVLRVFGPGEDRSLL